MWHDSENPRVVCRKARQNSGGILSLVLSMQVLEGKVAEAYDMPEKDLPAPYCEQGGLFQIKFIRFTKLECFQQNK